MKIRMWMLATVAISCLSTMGQAATDDVYQIAVSIRGGVGEYFTTNEVTKVKTNGVTTRVTNTVLVSRITSVVVDSADLVNLALGRELGTRLADNEILAVTTACGEGLKKIVVFDPFTASNLVTIGQLTSIVPADGQKKNQYYREDIADLQIFPVGTETNGLTGGSLTANIQSSVDSNGCFRSASGTMLGWLGTAVSSNHYQTATNAFSDLTVLVRRANLKVKGKPIGTLIDAD